MKDFSRFPIVKDFFPKHEPAFIIAGAQKSGTSSLHYYLNQHAGLCGSDPKELHFFDRKKYQNQSLNYYLRAFKGKRRCLYFESTPNYMYLPFVAKDIKRTFPNIKLVIVLRDPVQRAFSAWNHYRYKWEKADQTARGVQPKTQWDRIYDLFYKNRDAMPSFRECVEIELDLMQKTPEIYEPGLLRKGLYLDQLLHLWEFFPKNEVKVVGFKDLVNDPERTLNDILGFLGMSESSWAFLSKQKKNVRPYTNKMLDQDKRFLEEFYREPNQRLFDELGNINW
ncbi:MAG: sulfotransferase [Hydrogenovibrio sp.]|uniref:sulfotransferase family protein n=1 Tax=Hydrogenovibrio sp. TaxID=2065821 RepID=UPI00287042AB|nr:sulfotransferase [Hydrogenovibrio sp.]MDR9498549.1 sulfotransferase [Hydrogenovibrio sp.]MDR9499221.1 sulfotransferase [Hydrogenovibrio sp.]